MDNINDIFHPIDFETWERRQYFYYFTKILPTGYSLTVKVDITPTYEAVKESNQSFFAAYLYVTLRQLSQQEEFRISTLDGQLGYFDFLNPSFAVLHDDDKTMSNMWVQYGRLLMPYSFTSHHAVADGYHVSKFLDGVQEQFANPHLWIDK